MFFFYLFALVPAFIGILLWCFCKKVNWFEWLGSTAIAFVLAGITHAVAISGMTDDIETWSGQITIAKQFSAWQEYYEEAIYRTEYYTEEEEYEDSNGRTRTRTVTRSRRVFDHWEPRTRWHNEHFRNYSNIDTQYSISKEDFSFFVKVFNDRTPVKGERTTWEHNSRMIGGDANDYEAHNKTGYVHPVTKIMSWANRVKAAPSVFSFAKVPENTPVHEWPKNGNPFQSQRLIGTANQTISILELDRLNARLGPLKRVNVIIIGFGDQDSYLGHLQEAKWIGGKKNDLVITYGGSDPLKPSWVYVFGWTESEVVKKNLQSILLENKVDNSILPLIEAEVSKNYFIKDWSKFDYLTIEPPIWSYIVYAILMILTQFGFYFWAIANEFDKNVNGL